jgi:zinc protease
MDSTLIKTELKNGLTVHLKEIHNAPIISQWLWYRIGSRNEKPGFTGISHWVEHMQFKGTEKFPAGILDKAISRDGGFWNAFTYLDWTTYFETMPAEKIDLALQLEANRMTDSLFPLDEVESERTVIISEREGSENEPLFRLGEAIQASAFEKHPYHHEIIGDLADLKKITRDDLYQHYRSNYSPANAVLTVAGDFQTDAMLARITDLYQDIPSGQRPDHETVKEPRSEKERRLEVKGPGETTYLQIAYHAPAANDPDFFIFTVLDSLLTGPTSLNMFGGGGISNKTSRLYRTLVETEMAVSVNGGLSATIDPFLYDITVTVHPRMKYKPVLEKLDDEIKRIQDSLVSPDEINRAVKQARALFAYGSENITNQGFWLGYAEMFAGYDWFINYVNELGKVTPLDVQRVACEYLRPENRVVGAYLPTNDRKKSK